MILQLLADPVTTGFMGVGFIFMLIAIVASIFWLWMLIDCAVNPSIAGTEKIVWILVILFLHFVGALIYYFAGRKGRTAL